MSLTSFVIISVLILLVIIIAGLAIVNYSFDELYEKFVNYSKINAHITPVDFFKKVNEVYFNNSIKLNFSNIELGDKYSSLKTLTLCKKYAFSNGLAGLCICAHELGHAFQFEFQTEKMVKYSKKLRISKILSKILIPTFLLGIITLIFGKVLIAMIVFGFSLFFFLLAISIKLSTVKIEKEASNKALDLLQEFTFFDENMLKMCKKFLDSAKLTYVADVLKVMLKWTGLTKKF